MDCSEGWVGYSDDEQEDVVRDIVSWQYRVFQVKGSIVPGCINFMTEYKHILNVFMKFL